MKSSRYWVVIVLLLATFMTLHLRGNADRVPPSEDLGLLPQAIGTWTGEDVPITQDTLLVLGDGRFLNRIYTHSSPSSNVMNPPISLFIGYFPTQRTGQSIHSPRTVFRVPAGPLLPLEPFIWSNHRLRTTRWAST